MPEMRIALHRLSRKTKNSVGSARERLQPYTDLIVFRKEILRSVHARQGFRGRAEPLDEALVMFLFQKETGGAA